LHNSFNYSGLNASTGAVCASLKKITFGFFSMPQVRHRTAEGASWLIEGESVNV
jgi:hypothetical protein